MKTRIFKIILSLSLIAMAAVATVYWQRNSLLDRLLREKLQKIEAERGVRIDFSSVHLQGLRNLQLTDLCILPTEQDTLARLGKVETKISLTNLLRRSLLLKRVRLYEVNLQIVDTDSVRNFEALLHRNPTDSLSADTLAVGNGYVGKTSKLLSLFFRVVPDQIYINEMNVSLQKDSTLLKAHLPELSIKDKKYATQVEINDNGTTQQFVLSGSFSNKDRSLDCTLTAKCDSTPLPVRIPYIATAFGTDIQFDRLQLDFQEKNETQEEIQLEGKLNFVNLSIQHPKLSDTLVSFPSVGIDYLINLYPQTIELDSASVVSVNQLCFSPHIKITPRPELKLDLSIRKDFFPSQQLFTALPVGLFKNLKGIATQGELSYELNFNLDMAMVDNLKFHSFMGKRDFKIEHYGATNFTLMNEPFIYSAYENGALVRSFEVGENNPDFRTLENISPYLQAAVMYSEDGAFYGHKGFLETALTASIIQNIKEGRFARGGSTISMQLIKNLYLSRDKTLTRKLEEALIVWLVENNRLASKQRMLEVYLNIIEWGPGIYGANQAAHFYFNKDVAKLTPAEAIFMACVIPRPKKFYWMFDERNELRSYVEGHYNIVGKRMLDNQIITEQQFENLKPSVKLTGTAKSYLRGKDLNAEEEATDEDNESNWSLFNAPIKKTKAFFKGLIKKEKQEEAH